MIKKCAKNNSHLQFFNVPDQLWGKNALEITCFSFTMISNGECCSNLAWGMVIVKKT